ncbi:MAG: NAD synthetase [Moorea sp. SIO2B7]|nr:NAD synthetase [Moorena sp. SIO2B7]
MEPNNLMDWILGGVALLVLLGGLWMLLSGVKEMGGKS